MGLAQQESFVGEPDRVVSHPDAVRRARIARKLLAEVERVPEARALLEKAALDLKACPAANRDEGSPFSGKAWPCGLRSLCRSCFRIWGYRLGLSAQAKVQLLADGNPNLRFATFTLNSVNSDPLAAGRVLVEVVNELWSKARDPRSAAYPIVGLMVVRDVAEDVGGKLLVHVHGILTYDERRVEAYCEETGRLWAPRAIELALWRLVSKAEGREVPRNAVHMLAAS